MQRLRWDVIRARAVRFAADWAGPRDEKRDTQTFYNEFFAIFGVDRKRLATYEMRVELLLSLIQLGVPAIIGFPAHPFWLSGQIRIVGFNSV